MKDRDYSIDILKFLAVFLIINSHRDALYVKYSMLETGGAIGGKSPLARMAVPI